MDEELLKTIEKGDESEVLEFKKSTAQMEKALVSACAFLNHKGGKIYFGIEKNGKIAGQEVSDSTLKSISQKIRQRIKPEISPEIKVLEIEGKKIIEVKINAGNNKPHYLDGIAYKRAGTENPVISPDELERIILEKRKKYWDADVCEGAAIEDIDVEKVKWFLKKAKNERNLDIDPDTPAKDALKKLELMAERNPTNAAILLFGKTPQRFFLQSEARCGRFKGTKVTEPFIDMKVIGGNLFDQIDEMEKFVLRNISKAAWVETAKIERQEKWEYPPKAIRESIVNALCHRDYVSQSSSQVRVFDDRMEFWNPGALPRGWTVETLKNPHESKPPNPLLAKQLFWIKYAEDVGTGTNKIMKWCAKWELPEPVFEFTGTSIVVRLRKPIALEELSRIGLNERQIKAVEYVGKKGFIANKEFQKLNNTTRYTAERDLSGLVEKGVFIRTGRGKRGIRYLLSLRQDCPDGRFGINVLAHCSMSRYEDRLPFRKINNFLKRNHNIEITPASIMNMTRKVSEKIGPEYQKIIDKIRISPFVRADETSISINGIRYWIWIFVAKDAVLCVIRKSRGKKVVMEILGEYKGIVICDGWRAYLGFAFIIQRCWAHLLREAFALDNKKLFEVLHNLFLDAKNKTITRDIAEERPRKNHFQKIQRQKSHVAAPKNRKRVQLLVHIPDIWRGANQQCGGAGFKRACCHKKDYRMLEKP